MPLHQPGGGRTRWTVPWVKRTKGAERRLGCSFYLWELANTRKRWSCFRDSGTSPAPWPKCDPWMRQWWHETYVFLISHINDFPVVAAERSSPKSSIPREIWKRSESEANLENYESLTCQSAGKYGALQWMVLCLVSNWKRIRRINRSKNKERNRRNPQKSPMSIPYD